MLNKKLIKYIDSLETNGNFTKAQLLDIGLRHKMLPEGKDWPALTKYLQLTMKAESYRRWVNKQHAQPTFDMLEDISINYKSFEDSYKEKTQVRDAWNAYRSSIRREARIESFYKELAEVLKTLPEIKIKKSSNINLQSKNNDKEAILLLSDLHIGVKCENFYNMFDSHIAAARLETLAEDVIKYCDINQVSTLHILNLGDMIHGAIHTNARLQQEFDVIQQIKTASMLLSEFLVTLGSNIKEVTYRSVIDNHSRLSANKEDSIDAENLSKLIDFILEVRLKDVDTIKFIKDNLDEGLGLFTLKNGKKLAFAHGHQDGLNFTLQNICGATQSFVDYVALGHTHANKLKEFQGMSLFVNGSICGTEQYALGKRLFNKASQRLLIFDYTDDVVDIKINLQPELHMNTSKFNNW